MKHKFQRVKGVYKKESDSGDGHKCMRNMEVHRAENRLHGSV